MGVRNVDHKEGWNDLLGELKYLWSFANVLVYPASTATVGAMTPDLQWSCSPGQGQSDQEVLALAEKTKNTAAMLFLPSSGMLNSRSGSKNSTDKLVISVLFKAARCLSPCIILLYFLTWPRLSVSLKHADLLLLLWKGIKNQGLIVIAWISLYHFQNLSVEAHRTSITQSEFTFVDFCLFMHCYTTSVIPALAYTVCFYCSWILSNNDSVRCTHLQRCPI